jgi:hypothetical protein
MIHHPSSLWLSAGTFDLNCNIHDTFLKVLILDVISHLEQIFFVQTPQVQTPLFAFVRVA